MNPVSQSKFAKIIGCTPQFVPKIAARVTWVKVKGKKKEQIDLHGKHTLEYLGHREADQKQVNETEEQPETQPPQTIASGLGNNPSGLPKQQNNTGVESLKDKKTRKQIEEIDLKIEQKRGNLIEKNLTDIFFGKIYQIDSDQLKQLGSNLSPRLFRIINERNKIKTKEICELFETTDKDLKESIESVLNSGEKDVKTKIVGVFETSVSDILKTIKEEIDNFLDLLEADAV